YCGPSGGRDSTRAPLRGRTAPRAETTGLRVPLLVAPSGPPAALREGPPRLQPNRGIPASAARGAEYLAYLRVLSDVSRLAFRPPPGEPAVDGRVAPLVRVLGVVALVVAGQPDQGFHAGVGTAVADGWLPLCVVAGAGDFSLPEQVHQDGDGEGPLAGLDAQG